MSDEHLLKRMGVDPHTPAPLPSDPHCECIARWLEEREKRCLAESSIHANAQAYEALIEAAEREVALWTSRAWLFVWISAGILGGTIWYLLER